MVRASLNPETFTEGTGALPSNQNLATSGAKYVVWDYGKPENGIKATCLQLTMKGEDGEEHIQYWSFGDPKRVLPSPDGQYLDLQAGAQALAKSANGAIMMVELINAGFPVNRLSDAKGESVPVSAIFDGLDAHWIAIPAPKREGLAEKPVLEGEKVYPKLILVPQKINHLPGEKGGKKATTKAGAGTDNFDPIQAALALYNAEVAKAGGTQTRAKVAQASFKDKALNKGGIANAEAVRGVLFESEMVAALEADGFTVEGEKVSKE